MRRRLRWLVCGLWGVVSCDSGGSVSSDPADASVDGVAGSGGDGGSGGSAGSDAGVDATPGGSGGGGGAPPRDLLSQTGLYQADMKTLAEGVVPFEPRFILWSDGATKKRYVKLPALARIDTRDMDYWVYPVGTQLFKEFSRDGTRVETRLLEKVADTGSAEADWLMIAYQWNEEQTDAVALPDGVADASGTPHDIPSQNQCAECHAKMPDVLLGFTALQLSGAAGAISLGSLADEGVLSDPPLAGPEVPGDAMARAALGYLHANCGNCHQPRSFVINRVDLDLWLPVDRLDTVERTPSFSTTVGQLAMLGRVGGEGGAGGEGGQGNAEPLLIAPGDPDRSMLLRRMESRQNGVQMPPLASELVDADGVSTIRAWIESMPP